MSAAAICFVDTETTDVGPRRLAWDLAIIRREPDGTRKEIQTYIEVDLTDANPFALAVGRFHERHPLGKWLAGSTGMSPHNALSDLATGPMRPRGFKLGVEDATDGYVNQSGAAALWCRWTHGAHIVGAVPNFDTEVMGAAVRAASLLAMHHYHLADVENLIVGQLAGRLRYDLTLTGEERERIAAVVAPPWSSDDLFAEIGVTTADDERHTALGDARTCERVWDILFGGAA